MFQIWISTNLIQTLHKFQQYFKFLFVKYHLKFNTNPIKIIIKSQDLISSRFFGYFSIIRIPTFDIFPTSIL